MRCVRRIGSVIEESATVLSVAGNTAWVETQRRRSCDGCAARHGCGSAALSKVLGNRRTRLQVISQVEVEPGDRVVLGLQEQALIRGSIAVYLIPLLSMIALAVGAEAAFGTESGSGDGPALAGGLAGMVLGMMWLNMFGRKVQADARYQAVLLRRTAQVADLGPLEKSKTSGDLQ